MCLLHEVWNSAWWAHCQFLYNMCITHHWWPWSSFRCQSSLIDEIRCGSNTQLLSPSTHSTSAPAWREGGPGGRTNLSHLLLSPQPKTFSPAKSILFTQVWQQQPEGKESIIHHAQICVSVPSQHRPTHHLDFPELPLVLGLCSTISRSSRKNWFSRSTDICVCAVYKR